jgi:hypothetical protein
MNDYIVLTTVEMADGPYRVITDHQTGRSAAAKMPVDDGLLRWLFRGQQPTAARTPAGQDRGQAGGPGPRQR